MYVHMHEKGTLHTESSIDYFQLIICNVVYKLWLHPIISTYVSLCNIKFNTLHTCTNIKYY